MYGMIPNFEASYAGADFAYVADANLHLCNVPKLAPKTHLEGFFLPAPSPQFRGPSRPARVFLSPAIRRQRTSHVPSQCEAAAPAHQKCPEPARPRKDRVEGFLHKAIPKEKDERKRKAENIITEDSGSSSLQE